MANYKRLGPGDPAPWFSQRTHANPHYRLDSVAGRYIVLAFVGTTRDEGGQAMLRFLDSQRARLDDENALAFVVTVDPDDETSGRLRDRVPGLRVFWDVDQTVSRLYGALPVEPHGSELRFRRFWVVLDPTLRVRHVVDASADGSEHPDLDARLAGLPAPTAHAGMELPVPILVLPGVFEGEFCRELVAHYEARGGQPSGFMQDIDGKTVTVMNTQHKSRADVLVEDERLRAGIQQRIARRVIPEIQRVHYFPVTRMERYLIGCYDAAEGGHFNAHRDNTTKGTAHRRYALSINLNDDFDGGELYFPEYSTRRFKPPIGCGVVFSCSLMHAVSPVRAGRRYAFLPFLYDDAAAELRERNMADVQPSGLQATGT